MKHKQLVSISKRKRKLGEVMNVSMTPGKCCPQERPLRERRMLCTTRPFGSIRAPAKRGTGTSFSPSIILTLTSNRLRNEVAQAKPRLFRWHVAGDILSIDYLPRHVPDRREPVRIRTFWPLPRTSRSSTDTKPTRRCRIQPGASSFGLAGDERS